MTNLTSPALPPSTAEPVANPVDPSCGIPVNPTSYARSPHLARATVGRVALCLLLTPLLSVVPALAVGVPGQALGLPDPILYPLVHLAVFASYLFVVRLVRRRLEGDPAVYLALNWRTGGPLAVGLLLAAVIVGAPQVYAVASGAATFGGLAYGGGELAWKVLGIATVAFLLQGFGEELAWRGYLQTTLMSRISPIASAVIVAIGFGALHVVSSGSGDTPASKAVYALGAVGIGLLAAGLRLVTGSTWGAIGYHTGFHLANQLPGLWTVSGVRPSAGGSPVVAVLEFGAGIALLALWARRNSRAQRDGAGR